MLDHPAISKAHNIILDMIEHVDNHAYAMGPDNAEKISGHLGRAIRSLTNARKFHKNNDGNSAMLELKNTGDHINQAAKAFDIRDAMGQRVDLDLPAQVMQLQLGEPQQEFTTEYQNHINEGRNNGRKY
jgi:hypothetical protein